MANGHPTWYSLSTLLIYVFPGQIGLNRQNCQKGYVGQFSHYHEHRGGSRQGIVNNIYDRFGDNWFVKYDVEVARFPCS